MSTYNLWRVYISDSLAGVYNNTYQIVEQDAQPATPYTFAAPVLGPWFLDTAQTTMIKSKLRANTLSEKSPANGTYVEGVHFKSLNHTITSQGSTNTGTYSSILGGNINTISGNHSVIISGKNNASANTYGFIGSGRYNVISASSAYSVINSGLNNSISSSNTFNSILCGTNNAISGISSNSVILGGNNIINNTGLGGSYNFILGGGQNSISGVGNSSFTTITGSRNTISATNNVIYASINGNYNVITSSSGNIYHSNILGGRYCQIINTLGSDMKYDVICGGMRNQITSGSFATICGGLTNTASGNGAFIGGGGVSSPLIFNEGHIASGAYSVIVGGGGLVNAHKNSALGNTSVVVGGRGNISSGTGAFIGGGWYNSAVSPYSVVVGGRKNIISAANRYNAICGGYKNSIANTSNATIIGGGRYNIIINGSFGTICGGIANVLNTNSAFIGGGGVNDGTPAGGEGNAAYGLYSVVVGGGGTTPAHKNQALTTCAVVVGGRGNTSNGSFSFIGGGIGNSTSGSFTSILGGSNNLVGGYYSSILGGYGNTISSSGYNNFIIGNNLTIGGSVSNCVMFGTGLATPTTDGQFFSSQILNTATATGTAVVVISTTGLITRTSSTIKIKKNIRPITNDTIDKLYLLDPVIYNSKCETDDPNVDFYGLIAEYLESVFPEIVSYDKNGIPISIQYSQFIAILIAEAKRKNKHINNLKVNLDNAKSKYDSIQTKYNTIKTENISLLERIEKIEKLISV